MNMGLRVILKQISRNILYLRYTKTLHSQPDPFISWFHNHSLLQRATYEKYHLVICERGTVTFSSYKKTYLFLIQKLLITNIQYTKIQILVLKFRHESV